MAPCIVRTLRAVAFMLWSVSAAVAMTAVSLALFPLVYLFDPKRVVYHNILFTTAKVGLFPFVSRPIVTGTEHLSPSEPVVLVSNHQSMLDAFILTYITKIHYKATFKKALLYYPGVGQLLMLAQHLWVKRGDRNSGHRLIAQSVDNLRNGISVLFFPEGTRKLDSNKVLGDFKAGAFLAATKAGVRIVPITISGARSLFPPRGLPALGWGKPTVTIHPPIETKGKEVGKLMEESRKAVESGLRECDRA